MADAVIEANQGESYDDTPVSEAVEEASEGEEPEVRSMRGIGGGVNGDYSTMVKVTEE
jgi:hypothetical protein